MAAGSCLNMVDAIMNNQVREREMGVLKRFNLMFREEMVLQLFVHQVIMLIVVWTMVFVILIMWLFVQDICRRTIR